MAKLVAVGKETLDSRDVLTLNQLPNGKVTVSRSDGQVKSVQPNGDHEWRPANTAGAYEQATVRGKELLYTYRDADGILRYHVVTFDGDLPEFA